MTKNELRNQIGYVNRQILQVKRERSELEKKYEVLMEFSERCNKRAEDFMDSVARRKNKLSRIDHLTTRMKSALIYRERMGDMLFGNEYDNAKRSVDSLINDLERQKQKIRNDLESVEYKLKTLKRRLSVLQYEYNNYPEE